MKNNNDKYMRGMQRLMADVNRFSVRVDNLQADGMSETDAIHVAELEKFGELLREANVENVTLDSVRVLFSGGKERA